jgi:hypothetical protein
MRLNRVHRVISTALGELPLREGGSTFKPAGRRRDTHAGEVPENTGFTERQTFAELRLRLNATPAIGVEEFSYVGEDTLTIWLTGGRQYMMPNAWVVEPGELGDAEITVNYNSATSPRL